MTKSYYSVAYWFLWDQGVQPNRTNDQSILYEPQGLHKKQQDVEKKTAAGMLTNQSRSGWVEFDGSRR